MTDTRATNKGTFKMTRLLALRKRAGGVAVEQMTVEQWLAIRKEAALEIDPKTAKVEWWYAQTLDPYGVNPDLPEEYRQVGREYFACSPGNDVWVWFGDLSDVTRDALWEKHKSKLAFPAGLGLALALLHWNRCLRGLLETLIVRLAAAVGLSKASR
jgi:hypothetical protein